jgi:hypothetical protein
MVVKAEALPACVRVTRVMAGKASADRGAARMGGLRRKKELSIVFRRRPVFVLQL